MSRIQIECAIIRGGTTKGVFIERSQLPEDFDKRNNTILSLFGSPDTRQINGLGGSDPLTSKVAIINSSSEIGFDIDYESGEVGIIDSNINYSTMCGNLAAGAGLFALEMGLVKKSVPITNVRIRNLNTGKTFVASIPIENSSYPVKPCKEIDGVAGFGTEISLQFNDPGGSITGKLLPTGQPVDQIDVEENTYSCSIVDCGTLYAFFEAGAFGLSGSEVPEKLDSMEDFKITIESLREAVSQLLSKHGDREFSSKQVKIAIFAVQDKASASKKDCDIVARVIYRYKTHKAYAVTGAICISAAMMIPDTLLQQKGGNEGDNGLIRIGHPSGIINCQIAIEKSDKKINILHATINRSARVLIHGVAEVILAE